MAQTGFDLGEVGYADQNLQGSNFEDQRRSGIEHRLFTFIQEFEEDGHPKYADKLIRDYTARIYLCEVSFLDLDSFDRRLTSELRTNPTDFLPIFESAAKKFLHRLQLEDQNSIQNIQIQIVGFDSISSLRKMRSDQVSRLVCVEGIVISCSKVSTKATKLALSCRNCKTVVKIPLRDGFSGARIPRICSHIAVNPNEEKCPMDPYTIVADDSSFVDTQTLKLQENPEQVPTGEMPRNMMLHLSEHLVNKAKPGSRVRVVGILSIHDHVSGGDKKGGLQSVALRVPYVRVLGLTTDSENSGAVLFTSEEEEQLKTIARDENIYSRLTENIIAPEIFGHEDIKKAVACQLFGGVRQHLPDGLRLRGDIHILLLGDPSVAKSQFLKFAEKCSPIAVYTSGKGSSAAGLTASVIRDIGTGEFHLEGGALVLADGGIVCIDEFDKMRPQDRVAIHEAMEQQTISIAKAGITTTLNSRAGVLAAANPVFGRYDDMKSPEENIEFQSTILSRFDMIFVILDKRDADRDSAISKFVISMHQQSVANEARDTFVDSVFHDMALLKKYVAYARSRCMPCLSEEAGKLLVNHFVSVRESMRKAAVESGNSSVIPITVRQLEAIIRISESLAKMQLLSVATVDHVQEAIRLFQVSTLNAAQSGAISGEGLAGSDFGANVKKAESRILRRLPLGSSVSYSSLVTELKAHGEEEGACRRAIENLVRQGILQLKQQKKVVKRVSS